MNLNDITDDVIRANFPMKEFRPGQFEVIKAIIEGFKEGKTVLCQCPTGSGKSAIGYCLSQLFKNSYYLTPNKFLQDQLKSDFGENGKHVFRNNPMVELKGRNAYPCNYYERMIEHAKDNPAERAKLFKAMNKRIGDFQIPNAQINCDVGECRKQQLSKLEFCVSEQGTFCPYFKQLHKAMKASICLMNFHSFLFQTFVVEHFGARELLIIDEADCCEDTLMGFIEINLSDLHFIKHGIIFPELETVAEYIEFFKKVKITDIIAKRKEEAILEGNTREVDEWTNLLFKFAIMLASDIDNWICEYKPHKTGSTHSVILKPLMIDVFAHDFIFKYCPNVLLMSATILSKNVVCRSLGLNPDNAKYVVLGSCFPSEIRPIYFQPSGSMSYKNKQTTLPKMLEDIEKICQTHKDEKGIIHTHSFDISNYILEKSSKELRNRLVHQMDPIYNKNKKLMITAHTTKPNSIIIAPAMQRGVDLKDDLGRFQIICKVPYPPMGDKQVAARMEIDEDWFNFKTALLMVQAYGRIHRHDKDYGKTYILDNDFKRFYENTKDILPIWFKEVIIW